MPTAAGVGRAAKNCTIRSSVGFGSPVANCSIATTSCGPLPSAHTHHVPPVSTPP